MRAEVKFLVGEEHLPSLRRQIAGFTEPDPHAADRDPPAYTVRSIYLDTPGLRDYHEKCAGVKLRKKTRIRVYDQYQPGAVAFLEIKNKNNQRVAKDRGVTTVDDVRNVLATGDARLCNKRQDDARRFLYFLQREQRRPVVLVNYDREPYVGCFDSSLRVTFDKRLRGVLYPGVDGFYQDEKAQLALPGYFIMEVKYDGTFPGWMRPVIARLGVQKQALSKYVICLEAVTRRLPTCARILANTEPLWTLDTDAEQSTTTNGRDEEASVWARAMP